MRKKEEALAVGERSCESFLRGDNLWLILLLAQSVDVTRCIKRVGGGGENEITWLGIRALRTYKLELPGFGTSGTKTTWFSTG